jgi:chromosome segregation ATPase
MFRKLGITALVVVAGLILLNKTSAGDLISTAWSKLWSCASKKISLEFQIDSVRDQIAKLGPDMRKHYEVIAREMVAVDNLKEDIATVKAKLSKQRENILTMTEDLKSGTEFITYDGREYSAARVREKLDRDFDSYKRCEAELKSKEQLLEAKERSVDALKQQLVEMRSQKEALEVEVASMEAEVKTLRVAQTRSKVQFDDSRLARIKNRLAEIRDRLKVEKTKMTLQAEFPNDFIPVDKKAKSTAEITTEVQNYFGKGARVTGTAFAEKK